MLQKREAPVGHSTANTTRPSAGQMRTTVVGRLLPHAAPLSARTLRRRPAILCPFATPPSNAYRTAILSRTPLWRCHCRAARLTLLSQSGPTNDLSNAVRMQRLCSKLHVLPPPPSAHQPAPPGQRQPPPEADVSAATATPTLHPVAPTAQVATPASAGSGGTAQRGGGRNGKRWCLVAAVP